MGGYKPIGKVGKPLATLRPNRPFEPVYPAILLHRQLRQKFDDSVFSPQFEVQVSATHFLGKLLLSPLAQWIFCKKFGDTVWQRNCFGWSLKSQRLIRHRYISRSMWSFLWHPWSHRSSHVDWPGQHGILTTQFLDTKKTSWWFQPVWKNMSQIGSFSQGSGWK